MKPVKSPSRATALIIKKQIRKNEKNHTCLLFCPGSIRGKNATKQGKI